jgi:Fe-S-cluster-containing dehydrogenase component/CRP-like cAMP-binding protein
MPKEHKSRREVINAIKSIPAISALLSAHDGHFDYELDLEVTVYGRNYNGKKVGPYVKLLTYDAGEEVIKIGDWGGNTFFFVVDGALDVFVMPPNADSEIKVAELAPGTQFGEMSVLAGVPRNATIKPPTGKTAQVLEIQRPALRLLRKLPKFSENLDNTYRNHGRDSNIDKIKSLAGLSPEMITQLKEFSVFRIFSKNHVLFRQNDPIKRLYIVREGWLHRTQDSQGGGTVEDFLGHDYCLGAEGLSNNSARWPYAVTLMGRTEILEISLSQLRTAPQLWDALARVVSPYSPPPLGARVNYKPEVRQRMLEAQERIIDTGLVDGTNLLVMDMDLCVRCGNCSLACHKIHGQSRLTRRGVHVTRLEAPRTSAHQSVLSPEVCMHCKDPECLTGCPTGAIGRFGMGQVDIDPKTCIGCGDCATQCPYNAISMVPRKSKDAPAKAGFGWKLRDLFGLKPDTLPPPVDATEDLVAIKCNLCSDRETLNPPGTKMRAYSCEENCPTGALARINPREYFSEIGAIEGLMLVDKTHAFGRNIHKSDPPKRLIHVLGILLTALFTAGTIYGLERYGFGGSIYGFLNMRWLTGIVGLAGIAAVMTYPARRQVYRKRRGPLRYWMLVHAYIGVIAGIIILLHGGNKSGGLLTTALMISWDLVILTGIVGIVTYFIAPRMLTRIEGAPLLLDDLKARREELQKEVNAALAAEPLASVVKRRVIPRFASLGYLLRQYLKREDLDRMIEAAKRDLARDRAGMPNDRERIKLDRVIESVATLRRVDALILLHRSMKAWLPPHVATTSLMLALMIVHIIQVIYYASR